MATRRLVTASTIWTVGLTRALGLHWRAYEIDLTDAHARQFREVLAPYVSARS